ncbi:MAG: sulfite exporter TauE/SafE family protein [Peptostreptococcales bacterium]
MIFLIGFLSGILSGMGIGGGSILIPSLIFFTDISQHQAQGINLIVFVPAAISALFIHNKNKYIEYKLAVPIIISGVIFALIGSLLASKISPDYLRNIFAIFLLIVGILELKSK